MSYGKLIYAFITTAALSYSTAVQAAWPHDGEKVNAFKGEQTLDTPDRNSEGGIYADNILDTKHLDHQIRCVIQAVMKQKGPGDALLARATVSGRWWVAVYGEDSNIKFGVSSWGQGYRMHNALSGAPMLTSDFNNDFAVRTLDANKTGLDKNSPSVRQSREIAEGIQSCLSLS